MTTDNRMRAMELACQTTAQDMPTKDVVSRAEGFLTFLDGKAPPTPINPRVTPATLNRSRQGQKLDEQIINALAKAFPENPGAVILSRDEMLHLYSILAERSLA